MIVSLLARETVSQRFFYRVADHVGIVWPEELLQARRVRGVGADQIGQGFGRH